MKDKYNIEIEIGDTVNVPQIDDNVNFEFTGTVKSFNETDDYVIVEDQDGNCFCVEPELLEVENNFYVDIPNSDITNEEWINIESFSSKEKAIKFAQEYFGADENGMICIISKS